MHTYAYIYMYIYVYIYIYSYIYIYVPIDMEGSGFKLLKGGCIEGDSSHIGSLIGLIRGGDTRSLDFSSPEPPKQQREWPLNR